MTDDHDDQKVMGTTTFLRLTKSSAPVMRLAEAEGAIRPTKSDSGWRMFSTRDVRLMIVWLAQRPGHGGRPRRAMAPPIAP